MSNSSGIASNSPGEWSRLWDAYQISASKNPAQRFRRGLVADFASLIPTGAKFLDAGCGQGDTLALVAAMRPDLDLYGVELSESGVEATRSRVPSASVQSCDLLAEDLGLPLGFGEFDAAVCTEVLEHVDDPVQFLIALRSLLRPGGRIFITVPGGPRSAFDRHIGHLRHFTASSLTEVIHAAGFQRSLVLRRGFPVFNLYKCVVMLRGESLIEDVDGSSSSVSSRAADVVMMIFDRLFRLVVADSRFGWQLTAEAVVD